MNHLQHETSPYLLQHAHNPVEWYAWKPEAFERARKENKPIIVSIGYSTCHWCHVMERESFEEKDTAAFMNEHFINIKVDREERPDVDQIYMEACQQINGNGGWPLNCFLLPDGRPFFAGTYYPPLPAHNRPSWLQLMNAMYRAYRDQKEEVIKQAERLVAGIQSGSNLFRNENAQNQADDAVFIPELPKRITEQLAERFDRTYGGFGSAPKFPGTMNLSFLLDYYDYTDDKLAIEQVHRSLEKMIGGGIYDQIGGGFARYTVDRAWLVPHFEKMLYDNALLVTLMANAYRQEARPLYRKAISETLAFVEREMKSPDGGFYSALDADTEGEEGKFYVWSQQEIRTCLGDQAALFESVYGVSESGNWEGHNILWQAESTAALAEKWEMDEDKLEAELSSAKKQLLTERSRRTRPGLDDKQIISWNALMISAYCDAFHALGEEAYRQRALEAVAFVQKNLVQPSGALWHTFKAGKAQYDGFLDDYAFWIAALIDTYSVTFDLTFIDQAVTFTEFVLGNFLDETDNLFYFTAASQKDVPLRPKEMYDNALPSGNATMVLNLQKLAVLADRPHWKEQAMAMLRPMVFAIEKYPTAFGQWAKAVLYQSYPRRELAIIGPSAKGLGLELLQTHYPNTVVMAHEEGDLKAYPLLDGRAATTDTLLYVCEDFQCQLPVKNLKEAEALL